MAESNCSVVKFSIALNLILHRFLVGLKHFNIFQLYVCMCVCVGENHALTRNKDSIKKYMATFFRSWPSKSITSRILQDVQLNFLERREICPARDIDIYKKKSEKKNANLLRCFVCRYFVDFRSETLQAGLLVEK